MASFLKRFCIISSHHNKHIHRSSFQLTNTRRFAVTHSNEYVQQITSSIQSTFDKMGKYINFDERAQELQQLNIQLQNEKLSENESLSLSLRCTHLQEQVCKFSQTLFERNLGKLSSFQTGNLCF